MKNLGIALLMTFSFSGLAQVQQHPCAEFDQALRIAERQLKDFEPEIRRVDSRLRNIEQRLAQRSQVLSDLVRESGALNANISQINQERMGLDQEVRQLTQAQNSLSIRVNQADRDRQYHSRMAQSTRDLAQKRIHLREEKRLEREVGELNAQLMQTTQALNSIGPRSARLDHELRAALNRRADVEAQLNQERNNPSIVQLRQEKAQTEQELNTLLASQDNFNQNLARAQSHVQMCHGYQELSVKYPAALNFANEVYRLGCRNYRPIQTRDELEAQAQNDVLTSVCNR